ncbi:MAG: hypothetical protein KGJ62_06005 [Armatimonadetes bacterium]|nr:hypothetical protein [Armatimonadota bacterium]MDE2207037.1 hypothetical protein [Armatimonadota bacterium]
MRNGNGWNELRDRNGSPSIRLWVIASVLVTVVCLPALGQTGVATSSNVAPGKSVQAGVKTAKTATAKQKHATPKPAKKKPANGVKRSVRARGGKGAIPDYSKYFGGGGGGGRLVIQALPGSGGQAGTTVSSTAPFTFDFHGADIDNVLRFYAMASGKTVTPDPSLSGQVTIINPTPVTLAQAFQILQSVLAVRGFTAQTNGNVISIVPLDRAVGSTTLLNKGGTATGVKAIDPGDQVMTQVLPLQNVSADQMAKDLQPLINKGASLIGSAGTNALILTDTASNVERFIHLVAALDTASANSEMKIYPLRRAEAGEVADLINKIYGGGAAPTAPQPGGNPFVRGGPQPPNAPKAAGSSQVNAVPDTRTNSVIVIAPPGTQEQIADTIISKLDSNDTNSLATKIVKIRFADADKVSDLVNQVLSDLHGTETTNTGSSFQNRAFGGRFAFFNQQNQQNQAGQVQSSDPFGKVVPDERTNSLIITASPDRMARITQLIDQLDVNVPVESTTFVVPLKNAQASDVAYALGQVFQTYQNNQNNGLFGFFGGNSSSTSSSSGARTPINRALGGSNNTLGGRSAVIHGPQPPPPAPGAAGQSGGAGQGIPGVMTQQGFVPTGPMPLLGNNGGDTSSTAGDPTAAGAPSRQFFGGFGRGFGFGGQQQQGPQYGRGVAGEYANLLQLQGNVYVQPSPNGDAVIVTTAPANFEAVKKIIDELDVVPSQVMIQVVVAEVTLAKDEKLGFSLTGILEHLFKGATSGQGQIALPATGFAPGTGGTGGTSIDPTQTGTQFVLGNTSYQAVLQALATDSNVKVLATPRVFTSNNQQAEFDITEEVPYATGTTASGLTTAVSTSVAFQNIGFLLNVTPRITREGQVTIAVVAESSDLLGYQTVGTGSSALLEPLFNDRYADTDVTVQDGETVVIGGLMKDEKQVNIDKIPLLSDLPLIGQFFRSKDTNHTKTELLIFMTPHVVQGVEEARQMTKDNAAGMIKQVPELKSLHPGQPGTVYKLSLPPESQTKGTPQKYPTTPGAAPSGSP